MLPGVVLAPAKIASENLSELIEHGTDHSEENHFGVCEAPRCSDLIPGTRIQVQDCRCIKDKSSAPLIPPKRLRAPATQHPLATARERGRPLHRKAQSKVIGPRMCAGAPPRRISTEPAGQAVLQIAATIQFAWSQSTRRLCGS